MLAGMLLLFGLLLLLQHPVVRPVVHPVVRPVVRPVVSLVVHPVVRPSPTSGGFLAPSPKEPLEDEVWTAEQQPKHRQQVGHKDGSKHSSSSKHGVVTATNVEPRQWDWNLDAFVNLGQLHKQ